MSGWCKRGELNIWTKTKAFNIFKQFTGMDDLRCYSEILSCVLSTLWNVDGHIDLVTLHDIKQRLETDKGEEKEESFLFGHVTNRAGRPPGRWVEFCSSHSAFQPWTGALCFSNHGLFLSPEKVEKDLWLNWCTTVAFFTREPEQ